MKTTLKEYTCANPHIIVYTCANPHIIEYTCANPHIIILKSKLFNFDALMGDLTDGLSLQLAMLNLLNSAIFWYILQIPVHVTYIFLPYGLGTTNLNQVIY